MLLAAVVDSCCCDPEWRVVTSACKACTVSADTYTCTHAGTTGGSGVNFTDYIEFQHSDEEAGDEAEELLHPSNGVGSSAAVSEDSSWARLLKDIWKVIRATREGWVGGCGGGCGPPNRVQQLAL